MKLPASHRPLTGAIRSVLSPSSPVSSNSPVTQSLAASVVGSTLSTAPLSTAATTASIPPPLTSTISSPPPPATMSAHHSRALSTNSPALLRIEESSRKRTASAVVSPVIDMTKRERSMSTSTINSPARPFKMARLGPSNAACDTSYPADVRKHLRSYGLAPPAVESFEAQTQRCLAILDKKSSPIEKYQYLTHLRSANVHLFYRLLSDHIKKLTPIIYTPTVGEACQRWSEIYTQPEGMYISYSDRGNIYSILQNWPHEVEITVLTDGSRILGLGDLGINGMGIPVGKLALYTACAGIRPEATLPLTIDLGTSNKALREDPLYLGSRREKVTADQEREFLDELMIALTKRWPGIVIQFEDFKNPFPSLERYQDTYSMFNDDIQGTGAVILGGFINAVKAAGTSIKDHRAVFFGAGSAGVGVAKQIVEYFVKEGLSEDEARKRFWFVDSRGLVTLDRGDKLADHKLYFARDDNDGKQIKSLEDVIEHVKPSILMGLSTIGGAFTPEILKRMAALNEHPIIFPLSNPSSKSETTFENAIKYTNGKCLFASGSPFDPYEYNGKTYVAGQGNNMYVFPGIGLAAILSKAAHVTQSMIYASATALSTSLNAEEKEAGLLYPDVARIRDVSVIVTVGVIRAAQEAGVDRETALRTMSDEELTKYVLDRMYNPFKEAERIRRSMTESAAESYYSQRNGQSNESQPTSNLRAAL